MQIIYVYNRYHLGDNIFNYILFYNIKNYLEEHDIIISYFAQLEYHDQLKEFNPSKNFILNDYYEEKGIHLWLGEYYRFNMKLPFNLFLTLAFNAFLKSIQFDINDIKFYSLKYTDSDLLLRYDGLSEKYKNIDVLIVNSEPCSGQYVYNENYWNIYISMLDEKYSIVTTKKIEGINCTRDDNLTVKDIGALSTKVKVIIAINTGVVPSLLNTYTLSNVKKFYIFDDRVGCYSYPMYPNIFEMKQRLIDITFDELNSVVTPLNLESVTNEIYEF